MIVLLSVGQVAKELNISTQAIYLKINSSMSEELAPFIKEVARGKRTIKMIESEGVELIRASLDIQVDEVVAKDNTSIDKDILKLLQDTIEVLRDQLLAKDEQISKLNERLKESQQITQNHQVLLKDSKEKEQDLLMIEEKGWFDRLFKK